MADVHDVAAAVVRMLGSMTAMKMQKLVYYSQAWHLARRGKPIFTEEIQAWAQGPVVKPLYDRHRQHYLIHSWRYGDPSNLSKDELATVEWVVQKYGSFTAERLSRMSHNEIPWRVARGTLPDGAPSSEPIDHHLISSYYARQRADPDTAVALAAASASLEGVTLDTEWQERLRAVADGTVDPDRLVAEEIERARGD